MGTWNYGYVIAHAGSPGHGMIVGNFLFTFQWHSGNRLKWRWYSCISLIPRLSPEWDYSCIYTQTVVSFPGPAQVYIACKQRKPGRGLGTRLARLCLLFSPSVFCSWQVDSHGNFDCKTCHSGLSSHEGYYEERDECVNTAVKVWGFNPLLYTQTRVEPSMGNNHCLLSV